MAEGSPAGRVEGDAPLTAEDIRRAAALLAANNVPPFRCDACGAGWYVRPPAGWEPGDPVRLDCECGAAWTFNRVAEPAPVSEEKILELRIRKQLEDALAPFVGRNVTDELRKQMTDTASRVLSLISGFSISAPSEGFLDALCEGTVATREELEAWAEHRKVFPSTSLDDFLPAFRAKRAGLEERETAGFELVLR